MTESSPDRHSPLGTYHLAEDFFKAAVQLAAAQDNGQLRLRFATLIHFHLHCHSVELALKAFLRATGTGTEDLRRQFGHNLQRLLDAAFAVGLTLGADKGRVRAVVEWLNIHGRAQTFRYFESGYMQLPSLEDVQQSNSYILLAVRDKCISSIQI
jgi:hypothetical protein